MLYRPYVCRPCRLQHATLNRAVKSQQIRLFSEEGRRRQDGVEALFNGENLGERRRRDPALRSDTRGHDDNGPSAHVGRYSGRPLGPRQVLEKLDEPRARSNAHAPRQQSRPSPAQEYQDRPRRVNSLSGHRQDTVYRSLPVIDARSDIPDGLRQLREALIGAARANAGDVEAAWQLLAEYLGHEAIRPFLHLLRDDKAFITSCHQWSERICDRWNQSLRAKLSGDVQDNKKSSARAAPGPLQALLTCAVFGVGFKSKAAKSLWFTSRDLYEHLAVVEDFSRPLTNIEQAAVEQLMGLWVLITRNELRTSETDSNGMPNYAIQSINGSVSISWDFLPSPDQLHELIEQRANSTSGAISVDAAVSLLAGTSSRPLSNLQRARQTDQQQHHDQASSAVVTLDLLALVRKRSGSDELIQAMLPWEEAIETIRKARISKETPAAIKERMSSVIEPVLRARYRESCLRWNVEGAASPVDTAPKQSHQSREHNASSGELNGPSVEQISHEENSTPSEQGVPDHEASNTTSEAEQTNTDQEGLPSNATLTDKFTWRTINRLRRSGQAQDLKATQRIKQDVLNFGSTNPDIQLSIQVYEHLLLTFLSLRNFNEAMDCWKLLIQSGHQPTAKTYSIVLRYGQYLKGVDTLYFFWDKMKRDGVQPDGHAWAALVLGLARGGKPEHALRALVEMGQEWTLAAKTAHAPVNHGSKKSKHADQAKLELLLEKYEGDVHGVPRPTVLVMNSAITGLNSMGGNAALIPKVLAWGRMFGVKPDVITYNTLLNAALRQNQRGAADEIMQRMKMENVEANSDTWNILLSSMFESGVLEGLDPQVRGERIMAFIRGLEDSSSANIDEKGYAMIMDRMLKRYDSPEIVQKVLAHMTGRGIQPTSYHYTILMTHYFQQTPPDFKAIQGLWRRIQGASSGYGFSLGSQFYDRMIEGYATNHASVGLAPMLSFLQRMENEGKLPSWRALSSVVRALLEAQAWEQLASIVDRTRRRMRESGVGGTTYGQQEFWELVISSGVLRHEGITHANQIFQENRKNARSYTLREME